jgi:hypothetical protein
MAALPAPVDPSCVWQPDRDRAAYQAFARPITEHEYGGVIYKDADGNYCYSVPVQGHSDHFELRTQTPKGAHFDSIYHTHPEDRANDDGMPSHTELFSPADVSMSQQLGADSYIKTEKDGQIRKFSPKTSKLVPSVFDGTRGPQRPASPGEVVPRPQDDVVDKALQVSAAATKQQPLTAAAGSDQ